MTIRVGNAPCSWGSLEFEGLEAEPIPCAQMLDELSETGYTGTELGDWGYLPSDPTRLADQLKFRSLALTGAFVPVAFREQAAHADGEAAALRVAELLARAAEQIPGGVSPFVVLADNNGTVPVRTQNAGRVIPAMGLTDPEWAVFAAGVTRVAEAVRSRTGLRSAFHHHCAGFVETAIS